MIQADADVSDAVLSEFRRATICGIYAYKDTIDNRVYSTEIILFFFSITL